MTYAQLRARLINYENTGIEILIYNAEGGIPLRCDGVDEAVSTIIENYNISNCNFITKINYERLTLDIYVAQY